MKTLTDAEFNDIREECQQLRKSNHQLRNLITELKREGDMNEAREVRLTNGDLTRIEQALSEKHNRLVKKYAGKVKTDRDREMLRGWQSVLQYISRLRYEAHKQDQISTARKAELDAEELARLQHNFMTEMKAEYKVEGVCPLCERAN